MTKKKASKMGRPPMKKEERSSTQVKVNLTPPEMARLDREATKAGLSYSAYFKSIWLAKGE